MRLRWSVFFGVLCLGSLFFIVASTGCFGQDPADLKGSQWKLVTYSKDGSLEPVLEGTEITLSFRQDKGTVSGSGGCNQYSASYSVQGSRITFSAIMQTTMACEAIRNWQEGQYFHNLGSVERYTLSPGRLTFFSAGGDVLLVFEEKGVQPPASLRTTQWELISFHRGDTVFSVLPGTAITALFKDDGTLSGSAGCNEYHAVFTSDGAALSVGAIGTTKKNCANPEGIMVQESTYTAALVLVRSYSIDGNNLLLKNENGQIILSFRAADAT